MAVDAIERVDSIVGQDGAALFETSVAISVMVATPPNIATPYCSQDWK